MLQSLELSSLLYIVSDTKMLKYSLEIFLIFGLCLSGCREAEAFGEDLPLNGSSILSMLERKPKLNIVSFEPVGENIALGLDFLLPFINVPISREVDVYGNEPVSDN